MALALNCTTRGIVSTIARGAIPVLATLSPVADAAARLLSLPSASSSLVRLKTYSCHPNCAESPAVDSPTMTTLRPPPARKRQGPPCPPTCGKHDKSRADGSEQPSCSYDLNADDSTCRRQTQPPVATASPYQRQHQHQQQQQQQQRLQPPPKSAKRQAAEALLAARFGACLRSESPSSSTTTSAGLLVSCPFASRANVAAGKGPAPQHRVPCHLLSTAAGSDDSSNTDLTTSPHGDRTAGPTAAHRPPQPGHHAPGRAAASATAAAASDLAAGRLSSSQPQPPLHQAPAEGPPAAKRTRVSLSAATAQSLGLGLGLGGRQRGGSAPGQPQPLPRPTVVPPCDPGRGCSREGCTAPEPGQAAEGSGPGPSGASGMGAGSAAAAGTETETGSRGAGAGGSRGWCNFEVRVPPVNWQTVLDEPPGALQRYSLAQGYEKLQLPEGLVTYVVESPRHVDDALRKLRAGMQDPLIAIDLEWRPETVPGRSSPVAMLQLSSATVCVALRVSSMGYALPAAVIQFLSEPSTVLLGFGWEGADEAKMSGTFGIGRGDFRRFLDLQEVATCLGYPRHLSLARLAEVVLGTPLVKSKSVTRSNWAAPRLTNHQLKYASLDVLVAGQLFRALRLWHSSPSPCAVCRHPIGELRPLGRITCGEPTCKASAADLQGHLHHCANTGHKPRFGACRACGRTHELPLAGAGAGAEAAEQ